MKTSQMTSLSGFNTEQKTSHKEQNREERNELNEASNSQSVYMNAAVHKGHDPMVKSLSLAPSPRFKPQD